MSDSRGIYEPAPPEPLAAPTDPGKRLELVDALRGFALFGILVVNLSDFTLHWGLSAEQLAVLSTAGTDESAQFLIRMFGIGKFNTIFSFLFGLGFAMFMARGTQGDAAFLPFYRRRLSVLLLIGAVHMVFIWYGDIVALYAALGFVLILFRRLSDHALLLWAAVLIFSHPVLTAVIVVSGGALDPGEPLRGLEVWLFTSVFGFPADSYYAVASSGAWFDVLKYNLAGPPYRVGEMLSSSRFQRVLGMFLVGMWAGRHMIFRNPAAHRRLFKRLLIWGLPLGLAGNALYAAMMPETEPSIGRDLVYALGVVPLAMSYVAAFSLLWLRPRTRRVLAVLAPAGRAALTVYLSQTLICIALFYGIGLGFGGQVGPTLFFPIAVAIFAAQVLMSAMWLRHFRFGPVEWLWRSLTYGRREPLARRNA
ncbi:MAG TPA: DUF418 domain-containing protein [Gammaproteobacteria bacterium]|nr:DUF418 domain-containing protein [Gammaproteobacteria bacterium]